MKKIYLGVLLLLTVMVGTAYAPPMDNFVYALSSGEQTADVTINTGVCFFMGIVIVTDGTNDASATVYDNTANSGTEVWPTTTVTGADDIGGGFPRFPVYCGTGIRLDVGTNTTAVVYYRKASSTYKIPVE